MTGASGVVLDELESAFGPFSSQFIDYMRVEAKALTILGEGLATSLIDLGYLVTEGSLFYEDLIAAKNAMASGDFNRASQEIGQAQARLAREFLRFTFIQGAAKGLLSAANKAIANQLFKYEIYEMAAYNVRPIGGGAALARLAESDLNYGLKLNQKPTKN